jgi:ParB-like chromosome segregation protein Spo0J
MKAKVMKVELWPIERLIPYARNARTMTPAAVDKVAASIQEFGWRQPIVVDASRVIIAGHTRLSAARQLGLKKVPVLRASHLTPEQVKAYRLMDNRSHEETSWDAPLLADCLAELQTGGADLDLTGFNSDEITAFLLKGLAADTAPEEFREYDETIATEHECINCGYRWSGGSASPVDQNAAKDASD